MIERTQQSLESSHLVDSDQAYFRKKLYLNLPSSFQKNLKEELLESLAEFSFDLFKRPLNNGLELKVKEFKTASPPLYIVAIHQKNSPFLLDSLLMLHERLNLRPSFILHPVFRLSRNHGGNFVEFIKSFEETDSESFILIGFSKEPSKDILDQYETLLKAVHHVVDDYEAQLTSLSHIQNRLSNLEIVQYLKWLVDKNFVFLGLQVYENVKNDLVVKNRLGLYKTSFLSKDQEVLPDLNDFEKTPFVLRKLSKRSVVHRSSRITLIEIAIFDTSLQKITHVYQFAGLFTKNAYHQSAFNVPLLKTKLQDVVSYFGFDPSWYDGKLLSSVIESIPQDELYLLSSEEIITLCERVIGLATGKGLCCHIRKESNQAVLLLFISKDSFSQGLKQKFQTVIESYFKTTVGSAIAHMGDAFVARFVFVFPLESALKVIDLSSLEALLKECMETWQDSLLSILEQHHTQQEAAKLYFSYANSFSKEAQEHFPPKEAYACLNFLENSFQAPLDIQLADKDGIASFRLFTKMQDTKLSDTLSILTNLGFSISSQSVYTLKKDTTKYYVQEFSYDPKGIFLSPLKKQTIREVFLEVVANRCENDPLNSLVQKAELTSRQVTLLRAYLSYLNQVSLPYSKSYMIDIFISNPKIIQACLEYFDEKFNPQKRNSSKATLLKKQEQEIFLLIRDISNSDHDRVFRAFMTTLQHTLRTNSYQREQDDFKPYISLKISSKQLSFLPDPKPFVEVFVYAPWVQGVHLRAGKVARGGIRWSDRPQDFRTEILGLMKSQISKNAVIVPTGAKGGFVVTNSQAPASYEQAIFSYKTYIKGLLDITDSYDEHHTVIHPNDCVFYDDSDPYLVVAADKGTAKFSDIANEISKDYNFWLGDAFASGGSAGYDHKVLGITARGAFESVKRHFKELGSNPEKDAISVVGVGDMSGDVFGNGMLRSKTLKVLACFNHKHIFLDPNPDPLTAFNERKRLFEKGLGWDHYDNSLISQGGGVFERSLKTLPLSKECQKFLGTRHTDLNPEEVIKLLLKAPVDLLWFGGIGTYIKEKDEPHIACSDRANDAIRVNACDIGAKVIAEGANLAMTQKARVSYALKGGRINTETIDNAAGVDCSDHEVNIKILLKTIFNKKQDAKRNQLLKDLTPDVCTLVLKHNTAQAQLLSTQVFQNGIKTKFLFELQKELIDLAELHLERESLPNEETLVRRHSQGKGYMRPEMAILSAYTKNHLTDLLKKSNSLEKPWAREAYKTYFPIALHVYKTGLAKHPLKDDITATVLADDVINRMGLSFFKEMSPYSLDAVMEVYHWMKKNFGFELIEMLIQENPSLCQKELDVLVSCQAQGKAICKWILRYFKNPLVLLSPSFMKAFEEAIFEPKDYKPQDLLQHLLERLHSYQILLKSSELAVRYKASSKKILHDYKEVMSALPLEHLLSKISKIAPFQEWEEGAKELLMDDIYHLATSIVELRINRSLSLEALKKLPEFVALDKALHSCIRLKDHTLANLQYHLKLISLEKEAF